MDTGRLLARFPGERSESRRGAWLASIIAIVAAGIVAMALTSPAAAQEGDAPIDVIEAVTADLADREGVDPGDIEVLRTESVTWSDGCLGAAEPGEQCTQALVPGFVVWLGIDADAYRYHTDDTGAQFRLADGPLVAADVADAPLPEGIAEEDNGVEEPNGIEDPNGVEDPNGAEDPVPADPGDPVTDENDVPGDDPVDDTNGDVPGDRDGNGGPSNGVVPGEPAEDAEDGEAAPLPAETGGGGLVGGTSTGMDVAGAILLALAVIAAARMLATGRHIR